MSKPDPRNVDPREITPAAVYFNRRNFMRAGILAATTLATAGLYRTFLVPPRRSHSVAARRSLDDSLGGIDRIASTAPTTRPSFTTGEPRTSFEDITHYNNFYEFSTDKTEVAEASAHFVARPWKVTVGGLVAKPRTFDVDDLIKLAPIEQRIYRMRCVEGWSMVIPWNGFSLSRLLDAVQPNSSARYVAFETLKDPQRMPGQRDDTLPWPYREGLRMDEAMHPLTMLASGIYGRDLPAADGAPIRLVVPWKYGFKGIKSIVKIEVTDNQPATTWSAAAPNEYGFYANVNPNVDHPRWSQATEQRIGELRRRPTLMFNGYADDVASLYAGMDLTRNF